MRNKRSSPSWSKAVSAQFGRSIAIGSATQPACARGNGFLYQRLVRQWKGCVSCETSLSRAVQERPHFCEELYRFGGQSVYVSPVAPNGLTDQQYRALSDSERNR